MRRRNRLYILALCAAVLLILLYLSYKEKEGFQVEGPKKVAVLFSGRIKGYTHAQPSLEALQKKYDATFFVSLNKEQRSEYIDKFCTTFNIGGDQITIQKAISPDWLRSFDVDYDGGGEGKDSIRVDWMYSMVENIHSAFNLIAPYEEKYNVKFDCIVFYRADIDSQETMAISMPQENTVHIPEGADNYGINNQVAYGNYDTMKKYSELVNNLQKLCGEQKIRYHPETLLKHHLENEGLNIVRFPFNYYLHPMRQEPCPEYDDIP